jgi:cell volume regulation protein A
MLPFNTENILFIGSVLIFASIMISKAGYRYGVPALLLFLIVGMIFGSDGLGLEFNNYHQAQFVGAAALCVILFSGGMETQFSAVKPVLREGIALSTIGVILTAVFTGLFIYLLTLFLPLSTPVTLLTCLLLAAVMSSTDSATVFSILRSNRMGLKEHLQPALELESGSNDPMAYVLTVVLIQCVQTLSDPGTAHEGIHVWRIAGNAVVSFFLQLGIGTVLGLAFGYFAVWFLNRIHLHSTSLYAILLLSIGFFTLSVTTLLKGNGFLAVYLAGIFIGNKPLVNKREIFKFMDSMTWIMQIGMFLTLGLLVNPRDMLSIAPLALLVGVFLILVARPLTVFITLLPFRRFSLKARIFISWVGLKGAAPILFATYPVIADVPGSEQIFNIVFFITLLSMLVQGMSIPTVARWLRLDLPEEEKTETFGIEIPEEAGKLLNTRLTEADLEVGNTLKEILLPEGSRVVMIQRGKELIVPDGSVELRPGDDLLMIRKNQLDENEE